MRIATLANASVVHTRRWVEHFRARGHDVALWSLERGADDLRARPLASAPLPGALRYPLAVPELKRALAEFAPDLVDAHYVPNYGLMGALAGVHPLSVCAWGSDLLLAGSRDPLQRVRARYVLARADLVLADAENLAAAAKRLGARAETVRAIPWGVARKRFRPGSARVPGSMLSTRMHEPVYDLRTLIEGVADAMTRHGELTLEIAGDGSLRPELERLAAERLPAGRWRFLGRLDPDALAQALQRAEYYLSTSLSDSTSVSLLEAMACGATPVLSDLEGNREWVRESDGARLFAAGNPSALAEALERAIADRAWRERARERNARVIAERGDWDTQMAKIESLFESLAGGRKPDSPAAGQAGPR